MRWVALQPKGGNYFRGNLFVQPATQGMSEVLSYWVKTLFKKPFPRLCLHFLFMKTVLFPDLGVCWYTLSLSFHLQYISRAHLSPEIIFSHVSHFNVLTIQFSKKKQKESTPSIQNILIRSVFSTAVLSTKLTFGSWETFQGRRVTAALLIIVRI